MSELCVPLDYELLPETGQLKSLLAVRKTTGDPLHPRQIEQAADFIFSKLFRKLGYLARSTNKPGRLTAKGAVQFRESLEPLYGDDCDPVKLLVEAELLRVDGDEWVCDLFARLNPHLAGDFQPKHMKGNAMRQVSIAIKDAAVNAPRHAQMLFPEANVNAAGKPYDPQELDRLMLVIGSVDKLLKFTRQRTQFTNELLAAAAAVCVRCGYVERTVPEKFREFLGWLHAHLNTPRVPTTTEEILRDFETLFTLSGGK